MTNKKNVIEFGLGFFCIDGFKKYELFLFCDRIFNE